MLFISEVSVAEQRIQLRHVNLSISLLVLMTCRRTHDADLNLRAAVTAAEITRVLSRPIVIDDLELEALTHGRWLQVLLIVQLRQLLLHRHPMDLQTTLQRHTLLVDLGKILLG